MSESGRDRVPAPRRSAVVVSRARVVPRVLPCATGTAPPRGAVARAGSVFVFSDFTLLVAAAPQ